MLSTVIKETKYLKFIFAGSTGKTKIIWVVNIHHEDVIGSIKWFGKWRQYAFFPEKNSSEFQCNLLKFILFLYHPTTTF